MSGSEPDEACKLKEKTFAGARERDCNSLCCIGFALATGRNLHLQSSHEVIDTVQMSAYITKYASLESERMVSHELRLQLSCVQMRKDIRAYLISLSLTLHP